MKRMLPFLSLLLLLSMVLSFVPQANAATAPTVNIMTYNLKNSNYNFPAVTSMAKDNGADIVCMQEVSGLQYLGMNTAMSLAGYGNTLGKSSGKNSILEADEYLPIYYKEDKYKAYAWGSFWLSDTINEESKFSDSAYFRICTWGCYQLIGSENYILVFNTHLDFGVDLQIRQLNVILEQMVAISNKYFKAKNHMIFLGDLNCANTSTTLKYFEGDTPYQGKSNNYTMQRFDEARQIAAKTTPNSFGTYHTQPSEGPTMDLDHIYVTHSGFRCDSYAVLSNAAGSDHLPVLANLRFKTETSHSYNYRWSSADTHKVGCTNCNYSKSEKCSYVGDYCKYCGGSSKPQTFELVTSADQISTGRYLMVSAATGANPGSSPYYMGTVIPDGNYNAMQSMGLNYSSMPQSITLDGGVVASSVWYLSGTHSKFTLSDAVGNTLNHKNRDLYLNRDAVTYWNADFSTSAGHFAIKENSSAYLAIRTDLATIGHTNSPGPLFGCVNNTSTGNYKIFLYRDISYCAHSNLTSTVYPPTCTEQGYTLRSCPDCSFSETINFVSPTGHHYSSFVVPPTETSAGYTSHVCENCGIGYNDTFVDPIYTLSFSVPHGVDPIASMKNTEPLVLPKVTGHPTLAGQDFTFLGWTVLEQDRVQSANLTSQIFTPGTTVTISANVTLRAVYGYHQGTGYTERVFTLYDGSRSLRINDRVILVATDYDYAMSTTQNSTNRGATAIKRSSDKLTISTTSEPVAIFTLGWGASGSAQTGQLSFKDSKGYLRVQNSSANTLGTSQTLDANASWSLTRYTSSNTHGLANVGASSNNVIRYNSESNFFACYNAGYQNTIQIYYMTSEYDPTQYYTTVFPAEWCSHGETTLANAKAPTCEAQGYTGDKVCAICNTLLEEGTAIAATGHSYSYIPSDPGSHNKVCDLCGDSIAQFCNYEEGTCICGSRPTQTLSEPKLTFTNHSLSLASSIQVHFIIPDQYLTYDSYRILIEKDIYDDFGLITETKTYTFTAFDKYGTNYSKVVLDEVYATEMVSSLRATIYGYRNGVEYVGETDHYSIQTYALNQLHKSASGAKLKTLCVDLLNYGAEAQNYKSYNLLTMANEPLTAEERTLASDPDSLTPVNIKTVTDEAGSAYTFTGNALQMGNKVELIFVFTKGENLEVEVSYQRADGTTFSERYDEESFRLYNNDTYYSLTVDSLNASEMSIPVTAKLYCNGTLQSTCLYSIESYCASRIPKGDALAQCCTMMLLYGNSARAYFQ